MTPQATRTLYSDDFKLGTVKWVAELEAGGRYGAQGGQLELDVPAGATLWFKQRLEGPLLIEYDAMAVARGGPNDRVSDLNCFWMATDARSPVNLFDHPRSGQFADYNQLRTYYVGYGGNANSTTRFRRYIGDPVTRPLLPEHDLTDKPHLLQPNRWMHLQLVARDGLIQYWRDEEKLFELLDDRPYRAGWFGLRTVKSHLVFRNFRISSLRPAV